MGTALEDFKSKITQIDLKKTILDSYRPLTAEQQNRLEQKLRLDWNYHSNSIEGNTLTASETRAFILHGVTAKGKPFRDYLEMEGHNKALKKLEDLVAKEVKINESVIKELHKLILVEPYADAKAEINPGHYKTLPNYLYTRTGERIDFMAPEEVAPAMNTLINWLNNHIDVPKRKKQKYDLHPILVAAAFQVRFIQIHPFGDGNGRMARIMSNLILMLYGYTPAIIRLDKRDAYYNLLNLSTLEEPLPLAEMIADEVLTTLGLAIDAAKGLPLSEHDDLDKALSLLERSLENRPEKHKAERRSKDKIHEILEKAFLPIVNEIHNTWERLLSHFTTGKIQVNKDGDYIDYESLPRDLNLLLQDIDFNKINQITLNFDLKRLKKALPTEISNSIEIRVKFNQEEWYLTSNYNGEKQKKLFYGDEVIEETFRQEVRPLITQWVMQFNEKLENLKK
ncbi:Fic family protein [Mesonia sp.]|uniref:Fic family protein n=1 Tax=Mesonia sp. TaxID=1960830 RepID=UPI0017738C3E|nr:Fic family protein [Mesonia sp.]HIB36985.1 Fic family protein [Mesonia sp.]